MAWNSSRALFADGFLFQLTSGDMQRGKGNHILLGSPVTTFLVLAQSTIVISLWGNTFHGCCHSSRHSGGQSPDRQLPARSSAPSSALHLPLLPPDLPHSKWRPWCSHSIPGLGSHWTLSLPQRLHTQGRGCTATTAWGPIAGGRVFAGVAARGLPEAAALDLPEPRRAPSSLSRT